MTALGRGNPKIVALRRSCRPVFSETSPASAFRLVSAPVAAPTGHRESETVSAGSVTPERQLGPCRNAHYQRYV